MASRGRRQSLGFPAAAAAASTPPEGSARARLLVRRRPARTPQLGRGTTRRAPELARPAPPPPAARASRSAAPDRTPGQRVRVRDFTSGEGKRERKVCPAPAGEPARRTAESFSLVASRRVLPQRGLASSMPGAAAAAPAPARPGRRRLSRPNDYAAARLPPLPPRCECRPARARGAHTPAGWRALTHARTPPKAPPPPPPPPLAQGVGGGGERGGGGRGRRAGRRPITSAGSRRLPSQVFTPGKKKVKGKRPGTRRERGYERVGTGAPEKEKRRQREARRAPGETPERGLGPARTPRREEGPAGDRPRRPAPRCPGSPAGFRRPHAPGERAGEGEGAIFLPPGPGQTHLCLFSLLSWGRAFF